ncbi:MAG: VTT domain-containing protein [Chthoniobacterales bacterium]
MKTSNDRSVNTRSPRILRIVILAALALALPLLGVLLGFSGAADAVLGSPLASPWALPVFGILAGLLVGFALVPSHLTSLVAGFLYGVSLGFPVAVGVVLIGTLVGFRVSRALAGEDFRAVVDRSRWGAVLARKLIDSTGIRSALAVGLARLPPQVPFALGNVLAASCGVRQVPLLIGTVIGMAPRIVLAVWVGAELSEWEPGAPLPGALVFSVVAGIVGFGGLALWSWWLLRNPASSTTRLPPTNQDHLVDPLTDD